MVDEREREPPLLCKRGQLDFVDEVDVRWRPRRALTLASEAGELEQLDAVQLQLEVGPRDAQQRSDDRAVQLAVERPRHRDRARARVRVGCLVTEDQMDWKPLGCRRCKLPEQSCAGGRQVGVERHGCRRRGRRHEGEEKPRRGRRTQCGQCLCRAPARAHPVSEAKSLKSCCRPFPATATGLKGCVQAAAGAAQRRARAGRSAQRENSSAGTPTTPRRMSTNPSPRRLSHLTKAAAFTSGVQHATAQRPSLGGPSKSPDKVQPPGASVGRKHEGNWSKLKEAVAEEASKAEKTPTNPAEGKFSQLLGDVPTAAGIKDNLLMRALVKRPGRRDEDDIDLILRATSGVKFFSRLTAEQVRELCRVIVCKLVPKDSPLFFQGDFGTTFFIIYRGSVKIFVNEDGALTSMQRSDARYGSCVGLLEDGDAFGELALLGDGIRNATVVTSVATRFFLVEKASAPRRTNRGRAAHRALRASVVRYRRGRGWAAAVCSGATARVVRVWTNACRSLPGEPTARRLFAPRAAQVDYERSLLKLHENDLQLRLEYLRRVFLFREYGEADLRRLAYVLTPRRVPRDTVLATQGKPGEAIFFIARGRCRVLKRLLLSHEQRAQLRRGMAGAFETADAEGEDVVELCECETGRVEASTEGGGVATEGAAETDVGGGGEESAASHS